MKTRPEFGAAQAPSSRRVNRNAVAHLHHGALLGRKKEKGILPFTAAQMDLEGIMLSEINQPEEDKYHMISLICEL